MKRLIIFSLLLLGTKLFSQDQLFKKDNSKHEVKVLEVTPDEIKYKLKANPDGPLYIVKKSEVALIIYENGTHETYPDAKPQPSQTITIISPYNYIDSTRVYRKRQSLKQFLELTKNKNVAFVNILGIGNSCLSLSYLREFGKGYFSVHVPLSFSVAEPLGGQYLTLEGGYYSENVTNYKLNHKSIEGGLGIYFHTSGKRAVTHFVGPYVTFAQYNGTFESRNYTIDTTYGYNYPSYIDPPIKHGFVLNVVSVMLNNGFLIRITPELNLMIHAAIGFTGSRKYIGNDPADYAYNIYGSYNSSSIQVVNLGFSFGYRF